MSECTLHLPLVGLEGVGRDRDRELACNAKHKVKSNSGQSVYRTDGKGRLSPLKSAVKSMAQYPGSPFSMFLGGAEYRSLSYF